MALTLYGSAQSRATRVLWMLAELKRSFEHVAVAWDDPFLKSPAFLRLNPAGKIPVIVDDGLALSESLAINLYLARRYGSEGDEALYPSTLEDEARTWVWQSWSIFEAEGPLDEIRRHTVLLPPSDRRPDVVADAARRLDPALDMLEGVLAGSPWLVAGRFTVADLNLASVLSPSRTSLIDLGRRTAIRDWLARCDARPARIEARRALQAPPDPGAG